VSVFAAKRSTQWYCSSNCEASHYEQHKIVCNASESSTPSLKEGVKVVLVNIEDDQNHALCNGLEGRVVSRVDPERYLISFGNLEEAQIVRACDLRAVQKVPFEQHACVCGKEANLKCARCALQWYCSKDCQVSHYKRHKMLCKALASESKMPILDHFLRKR
jgi:hypothetical protein